MEGQVRENVNDIATQFGQLVDILDSLFSQKGQ